MLRPFVDITRCDSTPRPFPPPTRNCSCSYGFSTINTKGNYASCSPPLSSFGTACQDTVGSKDPSFPLGQNERGIGTAKGSPHPSLANITILNYRRDVQKSVRQEYVHVSRHRESRYHHETDSVTSLNKVSRTCRLRLGLQLQPMARSADDSNP